MSPPLEIRVRKQAKCPTGQSIAVDFLQDLGLNRKNATNVVALPTLRVVKYELNDPAIYKKYAREFHSTHQSARCENKIDRAETPDVRRIVVEEIYNNDERTVREVSSLAFYCPQNSRSTIVDRIWQNPLVKIADPFWEQKLFGLAMAEISILEQWPLEDICRLKGMEGVRFSNTNYEPECVILRNNEFKKEDKVIRELAKLRLYRGGNGRVIVGHGKPWIGKLDSKQEMHTRKIAYELLMQRSVHLSYKNGDIRNVPLRVDMDIAHHDHLSEIRETGAARMFHSGSDFGNSKFVAR